MSHKLVSLYIGEGEYYTRTDADNVIAELKNEIEEQKRLRNKALASVPNVLKVMKIIQHHKYKRCLANAERCRLDQERIELIENQDITDDDFNKLVKGFYKKWHKRWIAIAEKIKETKNG